MVALPAGRRPPAQFAFDLGRLHHDPASQGVWAFVASGAAPWLAGPGRLRPGHAGPGARGVSWAHLPGPMPHVLLHTGRRAARHLCLHARPGAAGHAIAPGLVAAGDHVQGPYPATLEGAVRSGLAFCACLLTHA